MLADEDQLVTFEEAGLAAAVRAVVARPGGLLGRGDQPVVFVLADEPDTAETFLVDPDELKAATESYVQQMVDRQVRAAVNYLRGKVD